MVAAKMAVDLIIEIRYKLRMLGVVLEETSVLLGDNMSVILNTTIPLSSLKKKNLACAYHRVREAIAGGIINFGKIPSELNMADMNTKPLGLINFHCLTNVYIFWHPPHLELVKKKPTDS